VAKVFVLLLTFIYAFSATGATVHLHYCCGEPQKLVTQYAHEAPDPDDCSLCLTHHEKKNEDIACCIDTNNKGCEVNQSEHGHCQNIKVEAKKTTEEHLPSADKKLAKVYPLELLVFALAHVINPQLDTFHAIQMADGGPPNTTIPLFIQHCTYRI